MRELPADLVAAVRRAREMEELAYATGGLHAQHRAIHATSALLLAACRLGWTQRELAVVSGLNRQAVHAGVAEARKLYGDETPALVFDAPVDRPPHRRRVLELPVDEREWLTRPEAGEYAGVHTFTIRNWFINGLLPHTQTETVPYLFLRADLARVLRAGRYNGRGVDYAALRDQLFGSGADNRRVRV